MSVIHGYVEHAQSGLSGIQAAHRDWSPYVVHFTSYQAMTSVRQGITGGLTPMQMSNALRAADAQSLASIGRIAAAAVLKKSVPSSMAQVPACVCLSECNLSGLIALSERYGRFGLVFDKSEIFAATGRPCIYIDRNAYAFISQHVVTDPAAADLIGLSNVYSPPGHGPVQDYTHEREWRIFHDLSLAQIKPRYYLCPDFYVPQMRTMFGQNATIIPIDKLFLWGA